MIRVASLNDLPTIVAIYNEAVEQRFATADLRPVTTDERLHWFRDHDPSVFPIYVADIDGSVRGWCSLSSYRPGREALLGTAEVSYYVRRDSQRQGVGSTLVRHAITQAPHLGKRILFGIVLERNVGSIRLMKTCGFELWGRLPDVASFDGELVSHLYFGRNV
jgi:L-amino acid N-acyltransferase YncA